VQDSDLSNLSANEFSGSLARDLLGFESTDEYARFLIQQRMERSLSTTLGTVLSATANEIAVGRTRESTRQLLVLQRGRSRFAVLVKTGPKSMNPAQAARFRVKLRNLPGGPPDRTVLGICYGEPGEVSTTLLRYLGDDVQVRAGKEFWTFLTDEASTYAEILAAARAAGKRFREIQGPGILRNLQTSTVSRIGRQIERKWGGQH